MVSSVLLRRVALVWFLQVPHGVTTQKTPFWKEIHFPETLCFVVFRILDVEQSPEQK
jgi:hypothetical protein